MNGMNEQLLGLFLWMLLQRHDGIIFFPASEIEKYPGMAKMRLAMEASADGLTIFVVEMEQAPYVGMN